MRFREKTYYSETVATILNGRSNCGQSYTSYNYYADVFKRKQIWDCVTPGYHGTKYRRGVLPYQPVVVTTEEIQWSPVPYTFASTGGGGCNLYNGHWFPTPSYFDFPELPAIDNGAVTYVMNAAIARAKAEAFDVLTFMAELEKSSRMLAHRFNTFFNLARSVMSRARRAPGNHYQNFSRYWLEGRYGWRPMMYDINGIIAQLTDYQHVLSFGRATVVQDLNASTIRVADENPVLSTAVVSRGGTRTIRGYAIASGNFGVQPSFRPFTTAWELVPFSFVVDWLFDIGSFISALTPIPGMDIRASGYSIKDSWVENAGMSHTLKPGVTGYSVSGSNPATRVHTCDSYQRIPSGLMVPSFFPRLNTLKVVDLVALVLQRVGPFARFLR